jgi:hypothetical protein
MENKTFSKIEIAAIKRTAQNVQPFVAKKEKINAEIEKINASKKEKIEKLLAEAEAKIDARIASKIEKLTAEVDTYQRIIDSYQVPIKTMTNGFTTEDLVAKESIHTGKIDPKTGKEIIQTRFVLKYPETVVPNNVFEEIEQELAEQPVEAPVAEAGNDFDLDVEAHQDEEAVLVEDFNNEDSANLEPANPFADNGWQ